MSQLLLIVLFAVSAVGCLPIVQDALESGEEISSDTRRETSETSKLSPDEQLETDASVNNQLEQDSYQIGDPISKKDYDRIDWNLAAYSNYFYVESGSAVIHYWNGGETILW